MKIESFPDRQIHVNGKEYLYFGGTSYLGIATNIKFQKLLSENLSQWGTFYGSSRNSNVKLAVYDKAEAFFSKTIGSEASLTVSSGMLAGRMVIDHLAETTARFFHYPKSHPAILAKSSLPLFFDDQLHPKLLDDVKEHVVICADAVLAMEVGPTSFEFLTKVSPKKMITLLIDESHSLGIVGKEGRGLFGAVNAKNLHRKILISSLGKSMGLPGGLIASDKAFIEEVKNTSVFISSSGMSPAHLQTFLQAQDIYVNQQYKLQNNLDFFFSDAEFGKGLKYNKSYPVIYNDRLDCFDKLFDKGIVITNFKYPGYDGLMSRIVLSANHTENDLKKLKVQLKKINPL